MNLQQNGKRINGQIVYDMSYDTETGKYTCTCEAFIFEKECKHLREFRKAVEQMEKDNEVWSG